MTTTSALPVVLGWLYDTFTADSRLGAAPGTVAVHYLRPLNREYARSALFVGVDDPEGVLLTAAQSTQKWTGPGARMRDENLTINCMAEEWTGDELDIRAATERCFTTVAAVEDITRGSADLGGTILYTSPGVNNHRLTHGQTAEGLLVRLHFTIDGFARIGA